MSLGETKKEKRLESRCKWRMEEEERDIKERRKERILRIKELKHVKKGSPGDLRMRNEVKEFVSPHLR